MPGLAIRCGIAIKPAVIRARCRVTGVAPASPSLKRPANNRPLGPA